jgi:hypothetical protein
MGAEVLGMYGESHMEAEVMGIYLCPNLELVVGKYASPPYKDEVYAALVVGQYP